MAEGKKRDKKAGKKAAKAARKPSGRAARSAAQAAAAAPSVAPPGSVPGTGPGVRPADDRPGSADPRGRDLGRSPRPGADGGQPGDGVAGRSPRPGRAGQPELVPSARTGGSASRSGTAVQDRPGTQHGPGQDREPAVAGARAAQATRLAPAGRAGTTAKPATAPAAKPGDKGKTKTSPAGPAAAPKRRGKLNRPVVWAGAGCLVLAAGGVAFFALSSSGVPHVLVIPDQIGSYTKQPRLAQVMDAAALQKQVVAKSAGEAKNVIYAVYQDRTGPAAQANPKIILFIGGNLTGTSDGGFIDSFTGQSAGAQRIDPGSLGGSAACLPRVPGGVAECAWADNDTFGVVASPTLSVTDLANELRTARSQIEHRK
ncbi:MAG TPA: hypothetical protein VGQ05_07020 [Streptosporangiaceae bacterium]|nr:hypothetical protein [Streptosporangiaceae bacterium]